MIDSEPTYADAVRAMEARGIDGADELLEHASPDAIIAACEWWDGLSNVGTGLLVKTIRGGGRAPAPPIPLASDGARRVEFDKFVAAFPVGAIVETHKQTQRLMSPDDPIDCDGNMRVFMSWYPHVGLRCDKCDHEAAIGISPPGAKTPRGVPAPQRRMPR